MTWAPAGEMSNVKGMAKDTQPVRGPQFLLGILLLLAGAALLLNRLDVVDVTFWGLVGTWWPLAIVAVGLSALLTVPRAWPGPVVLITIGVLLQLSRLDVLNVDIGSLVWPIVLILVGLALLLRVGRSTNDTAEDIRSTVFWWGSVRRTSSPSFRSAVLTAIMGGIELDLRDADIQGRADVSIFTFWGGVDVKVPPTWRVRVRGLPLLGGWDDKTVDPPDPNAPELRVHVTAIMGGADIKNRAPRSQG